MATTNGRIAITIARQLGAGGGTLGQRLADRLKIRILDSDMLRLAAEKAGVPEKDLARWDEHRAKFWEQIERAVYLSAPEGAWVLPDKTPGIYDRDLFRMQTEVIQEVASKESCVVIGRAGYWVLRDYPGLIAVYVHGAPETRLERVKAAFKADDRQARGIMAKVDADRARFLREVTGQELRAETQHVCIDTGRISLEVAEEMVMKVVEQVKG